MRQLPPAHPAAPSPSPPRRGSVSRTALVVCFSQTQRRRGLCELSLADVGEGSVGAFGCGLRSEFQYAAMGEVFTESYAGRPVRKVSCSSVTYVATSSPHGSGVFGTLLLYLSSVRSTLVDVFLPQGKIL